MIKVGSILSETQFYTVESVIGDEVFVKDELGNDICITKEYVEKLLNSADNFSSEVKITVTEMADLFHNSTRIAMTVCFKKKDAPKSAKAIKAEKDALKAKLKTANLSELQVLIDNFVENPIQTIIPGELRVIKGRHYNKVNTLGRIDFIDMEISKDANSAFDSRVRQVDSRTIQYIIVNDVKYTLK